MSAQGTIKGPEYGEITKDLSIDRSDPNAAFGEGGFETIHLENTSAITPTQVPGECYLHFAGDKTNVGIDLRDFVGKPIQTIQGEPFGVSYLENPADTTGTLRILQGLALVTGSGQGDARATLARVTNVTPGADTNVQSGGADLDVVPPGIGSIIIKAAIEATDVNASLKVEEGIDGGATLTYQLNSGEDLNAGSLYSFAVPCRPDAQYNVQVDTAGVELDVLQLDYSGELV